MSRKRRFFTGLLVLLLVPTLVVALFTAYAYWDNSRPQTGALQTWVKPAVVLPWRAESSYFIRFSGDKAQGQPTPPIPVDIVFINDISSSMTEYLPAMADAAADVLRELVTARPGQMNFSLIRFDTGARIDDNQWTDDPEKLHPGLKDGSMVSSGGTDPRDAFVKLDELLSKARSQSKKTVIFFTDGEFGGMSDSEIMDKSKSLRDSGVDIFSVGVPVKGSADIIYRMTDDPKRVFNPTNARDLAANFRMLAEGIVPGFGEGGQLSNKIDGRHFSTPLEGTNWSMGAGNALNLEIGKLPETPVTYAHPLVGRSAGLWSVGTEPSTLLFTDKDDHLQSISATHRPAILVITWFTLFLMMLPALLWALFHIPVRRRTAPEEEWLLPEILHPRPPNRLPALPRLVDEREAPIPTLFVGLGGAGRRALLSARADLKQAHHGSEGHPYRFLYIDLDTKEPEKETPFDDWQGYPIEEMIAPPEIRQTQLYLPEPGKTPEHLNWFDARGYQNATRSEMNLSEGAKGDRALARLTLFEWLKNKDALLTRLVNICKELSAFDSKDGTRQIVIFASSEGGVGSGWFLDMGRLLHRIGRQQQAEGSEFAPEIIGVLSDSEEPSNSENRKALEMEIDSATLNGAFPQRITYAPGEPLLDHVDTESAYDWIFKAVDQEAQSLAAQCGELAVVLVERHPRSSVLGQAAALEQRHSIQTISHGLHILPTLIYEQIRYELFLRLAGPDILVDIEPDVRGGFGLKAVPEETASRRLEDWSKDEPPGTPWQLLMAAANNSALVPIFVNAMQGAGAPSKEWFGSAFSASLTRKLHGHANLDGPGWHRDLMPGEAIATLRLLAGRIERMVKPQAETAGAGPKVADILDTVAKMAGAAADELERWVQDLCVICEKVSLQRSDLSQIQGRLARLNRRTYIESSDWRDRIEDWTRSSLETWLGTPDTISPIRERLFFSALLEGSQVKVVVRSFIESARKCYSAEELAEVIDRYARALAYLVPAVKIEGSLSDLSEERRKMLARSLVNTQTAPRRVLVVTPNPAGRQSQESRVLEAFKNFIPQPANHGRRNDQSGDDHSAIRRIELVETVDDRQPLMRGKLPYVEAAEQAAELVRLRAEKKHQIVIPPFPPQLRISLAHPESFRSFARAYKAGRIVRRPDASGVEHWTFLDTGEFLTFNGDRTLAAAAANYVWYVKSPPRSFTQSETKGLFDKMEHWLRDRNSPDDDTLVQIAIDVYES